MGGDAMGGIAAPIFVARSREVLDTEGGFPARNAILPACLATADVVT